MIRNSKFGDRTINNNITASDIKKSPLIEKLLTFFHFSIIVWHIANAKIPNTYVIYLTKLSADKHTFWRIFQFVYAE